jgi:hypothetical protein
MAVSDTLRRICRAGAILCTAAVLGTALPAEPGFAAGDGPASATGRIWIYRIFDPSITLDTPYVRINGAIVAVSRPGSAFYRDLPPGNYRITADSRGSAPGQFASLTLVAGQSVFVKVDADNWWASAGCQPTTVTFYTLVVAPLLARAEMAGLAVGAAG